jgi:protein HOOK3
MYGAKLTFSESDVDDDARAVSVQKEHERMLVLQERTNDRLRELELANAEKAGLLRAALLDRENLPLELLELKRAETIQDMRERIESVLKAPAEAQPKVLDTTSLEIAETVLSSEAALDKAKKVSTQQISHTKSPSSAFEVAVSAMRRNRLEPSYTAATLVSPASPQKSCAGKNKSLSEISTSTVGTGQTTWDRITQLISPKRRRPSAICDTEYRMLQASNDGVASLSLASLPEYNYPCDMILSSLPFRATRLTANTCTRTSKISSTRTTHCANNSSKQRQRRQRRVRYVLPLLPTTNFLHNITNAKKQAELQQEVENLRRENALVKSMWYDMNQRLLSNTVILQRRSEAPKGWLGKQRAAVGGGASVLVR